MIEFTDNEATHIEDHYRDQKFECEVHKRIGDLRDRVVKRKPLEQIPALGQGFGIFSCHKICFLVEKREP